MSEAQPPEQRMVTIVEPGNLQAERALQRSRNSMVYPLTGSFLMLPACSGITIFGSDGHIDGLFEQVGVAASSVSFIFGLVFLWLTIRDLLREDRGRRPIPGVAVVDAYLEEEWDSIRDEEGLRLTAEERTAAFRRLYYVADELGPWLDERHRLLGEPEMAQDLRRAELIIRATLRRKVREERALPTQIMHELGEQDPAPTSVTPDELAEEVRRAEERAQRERRPRRSNPPMPT